MANVQVAPSNNSITGANRPIVRTSGDRVYVATTNSSTTVTMWKGNQDGVPTSFTSAATITSLTGLVNKGVAIAIDSSNIIHCTYYVKDTSHGGNLQLQYVTFNTGTDTFGTVEEVATLDADGLAEEKTGVSIDANGDPHVFWRDGNTNMGSTTFSNYYSSRIDGVTSNVWDKSRVTISSGPSDTLDVWDIMIADPASSVNADRPICGEYDGEGTNDRLNMYHGTALNATAFTAALDVTGSTAVESTQLDEYSMIIDSNEKITVVYLEDNSINLEVVEHLNSNAWGTWETPVVLPVDDHRSPSISEDGAGNRVIMVEQQNTTIDGFISKNDGSWSEITDRGDLPIVGGDFVTAKVKWASKNNNLPKQMDFVFENDNTNVVLYNTFNTIQEQVTHTTNAFLTDNSVEITHTTSSVLKHARQISTDNDNFLHKGGRMITSKNGILYFANAWNDPTVPTRRISMWKSIDKGVTWVEQDRANSLTSANTLDGVSSAIDSTGVIYVVFQRQGQTTNLALEKRFNTSTDLWVAGTVTIEDSTVALLSNMPFVTVVIDENDDAHVVYAKRTGGIIDIRYSNKIGGSWSSPIDIPSASNARICVMCFDDRGFPIVVIHNATATEAEAFFGNALDATSFTLHTLDAVAVFEEMSIAKDQDGDMVVIWQETTNDVKSIRHNAGDAIGTWQTKKTIVSGSSQRGISIMAKGKTFYVEIEDEGPSLVDLYREINDAGWTKLQTDGTLREVNTGNVNEVMPMRWAEFNEPFGDQLDLTYQQIVATNDESFHGYFRWNPITHSTDASLQAAAPSAQTRTHDTDALLEKHIEITHTTDALLEKHIEITHTTDALLEKHIELTHTTDSLLKKFGIEIAHTTDALLKKFNILVTHDTDALLEAHQTLTHTTDSLLEKHIEIVHTTDSLLKKFGIEVTHTTDSLLKKFGIEVTHTTDALLVKRITVTHTTDALLEAHIELTHTTDSLLKKFGIIVTHTTDALKKKFDITVEHTTDSLLKKFGIEVTHTTDALLKKFGIIVDHTTDALLEAHQTLTHTTDAFLRKTIELTHTTDSLLKKFGIEVTHTTDALKKKFDILVTHTTDTALQRVDNLLTHTTDSLLKKLDILVTHTTDAFLKKAVGHSTDAFLKIAVAHSTDAFLQGAAVTIQHTTDASLLKIQTVTHTTDSLLKKFDILVTHTTDALKQKTQTVVHTTDSLLKKFGIIVTHTTDSSLKKFGLTITHTTDSLLSKIQTVTHTTDSLLKKLGIEITHTTDALLLKIQTLTHTTDALLQKEQTLTHTTDSLLKKFDIEITHTTDSRLVAVGIDHTTDAFLKIAVAHSTDALLESHEERTHTTDAKLVLDVSATHTTDSVLVRGQKHTTDARLASKFVIISSIQFEIPDKTPVRLLHSTDSKLVGPVLKTHTTDAKIIQNIDTKVHSTNSVLAPVFIIISSIQFEIPGITPLRLTHTTDAKLSSGITVSHGTNSFLAFTPLTTHTTDALLQRVDNLVIHTTDAFLQRLQTVIHTTDSLLKKFGQLVTHTTDAFLEDKVRVTHTTDALLKKFGVIVSHTTDAALQIVDNLRTHTTDAFLSKIRTLTHTTDSLLADLESIRTHTTDALLEGLDRTRTHTTDALIQEAGVKTHTTDAYIQVKEAAAFNILTFKREERRTLPFQREERNTLTFQRDERENVAFQ